MNEILKRCGKVLYGYIIHYNHNNELWYAIPRDQYVDYWNGTCTNCLTNVELSELILDVYEIENKDEKM
jgi:hypothetical protein